MSGGGGVLLAGRKGQKGLQQCITHGNIIQYACLRHPAEPRSAGPAHLAPKPSPPCATPGATEHCILHAFRVRRMLALMPCMQQGHRHPRSRSLCPKHLQLSWTHLHYDVLLHSPAVRGLGLWIPSHSTLSGCKTNTAPALLKANNFQAHTHAARGRAHPYSEDGYCLTYNILV